MDKTQIIAIIVEDFTKRLNEAPEHIIYGLYSEYLIKKEEDENKVVTLHKVEKGVKKNEV